jgi:hypothetical protein
MSPEQERAVTARGRVKPSLSDRPPGLDGARDAVAQSSCSRERDERRLRIDRILLFERRLNPF